MNESTIEITGESISPTRKCVTQQEMIEEAKKWLHFHYGFQKPENPDKYFEKLGLLYDFITDFFPQ